MGFFAVGISGADELSAGFLKKNDDYSSIMTKALADRLAEAFAEFLHHRVRKQYWGYAADEKLSTEDLIAEKYRGIRPAPGYPACPDHTEKAFLFEAADVTKLTGVTLTESFAMHPGAAVSGYYFAHPKARYFAVGKLEKDQIEDYAERKRMGVPTIEKWLSPNLNYEA